MIETKRCPICGALNEYEPDPDVDDYGCDTCGYFDIVAYGEGGSGIAFNRIAFDWLTACKEAWESGHYKKGGTHE